MKKICTIVLTVSTLFMFTACENSLTGTWYELGENPDDTYHQLILSDDGQFIKGSDSGEWSVSDDTLMLMSPWDSRQMQIVKSSYDDSLVGDNGSEWVKDYDVALQSYEDAIAEKEAEAAEEAAKEKEDKANALDYAKENISGSYATNDAFAFREKEYTLVLNNDGTYLYTCNDLDENPLRETGKWKVDEDSCDIDYRGFISVEIDLTDANPDERLKSYEEEKDAKAVLSEIIVEMDRETHSIKLRGHGIGFSSGLIYIPDGPYVQN